MPCHLFCADLGRNCQRGGTWAADGSTPCGHGRSHGLRRHRRSGGRVGSPRHHHVRTRSPSCMRRGRPADRPWRRPGSRASPAIGIGQVKALDGRDGDGPPADLCHAPFDGGTRMIEGTECRHARPVGMAIGHRLAAVRRAQQIGLSDDVGAGDIRPTALVRWRPVDHAAIARRIVRYLDAG